VGGWSGGPRIHIRQRIVSTYILMGFSYIKLGLMRPVLGTHGAGACTRYRLVDLHWFRVPGGTLFSTGTYVRYLIHQCFTK
jgi:hypothetical protein